MSGPLRDRIDLYVDMPRVDPRLLVGEREPEGSAHVAPRIAAVRVAAERRNGGRLNARLRGRHLRALCRLGGDERRRVAELADAQDASGRGTERLLRVARTIADLAGEEAVGLGHLAEAAAFGPLTGDLDQALAS